MPMHRLQKNMSHKIQCFLFQVMGKTTTTRSGGASGTQVDLMYKYYQQHSLSPRQYLQQVIIFYCTLHSVVVAGGLQLSDLYKFDLQVASQLANQGRVGISVFLLNKLHFLSINGFFSHSKKKFQIL